MLEQRSFDLGAVDVLPAANYDVLQPVDDAHTTIVVLSREVTGVEPAVLTDRYKPLELRRMNDAPTVGDISRHDRP